MPSKKFLFAVLTSALSFIVFLQPLPSRAGRDEALNEIAGEQSERSPERRPLSDEDVLNPKKLVFDVSVPYLDSFDKSPKGMVFISKRSVLGSSDPRYGVIGEKDSPRYKELCLFFCPPKTTDIDATYVYVFEVKGECSIGVRAIGWMEEKKEQQGGWLTGQTVVTGRVQYTGQPVNIDKIAINGQVVGPPTNRSQLSGPYGTNYKYFPRNKEFGLLTSTANSSDLSAGFITDLHMFPAGKLVREVNSGSDITIEFPSWRPKYMAISGDSLVELKSLISKCEVEEEKPVRRKKATAKYSKR